MPSPTGHDPMGLHSHVAKGCQQPMPTVFQGHPGHGCFFGTRPPAGHEGNSRPQGPLQATKGTMQATKATRGHPGHCTGHISQTKHMRAAKRFRQPVLSAAKASWPFHLSQRPLWPFEICQCLHFVPLPMFASICIVSCKGTSCHFQT